MKVFIVIDETTFFHPQFLEGFLKRTPDEIVGACLVTKILPKNNLERDMIKRFYNLRPSEIFLLGYNKIKYLLLDVIDKKNCYTVRSVLKKYNIPFIDTEYNINQEKYINYIRECAPDVLVSSQSLYIGKTILDIPKICCINRHSGLLTRNGEL